MKKSKATASFYDDMNAKAWDIVQGVVEEQGIDPADPNDRAAVIEPCRRALRRLADRDPVFMRDAAYSWCYFAANYHLKDLARNPDKPSSPRRKKVRHAGFFGLRNR